MVSFKQNFTSLQIIQAAMIYCLFWTNFKHICCGEITDHFYVRNSYPGFAITTFSLQVRISLHSYVVSYVTYKLSVCKQLLTSTHGSTATPASIIQTDPIVTTS